MPKALAIFWLAILSAGSATAGLRVTHSALPPTGSDLLLAYDVSAYQGGYDLQHGSAIAIDLGQTFRLSRAARLDKVTVRLRPETDLGHDALYLFVGTYTDPQDHSMNEVLHYELGGIPDDLPVHVDRYVTLDLAAPVPLEADRQYGFKIAFAGGGNVNDARAEILHLGEDRYPAGLAFDDAGAFTSPLEFDLAFFLHALESGPPPPPPPPPMEDEVLSLHGDRFEVVARWLTAAGTSGWGQADRLTDQTGCFWFFGEENLEIFVKVLDACDAYGHYWVFLAGLTNVDVTVRVTDRFTGIERAYRNPLGQFFAPIYDVRAFATCP